MISTTEIGEFDFDSFDIHTADVEIQQSESVTQIHKQIIIAVDASNSMKGYKIGAVNDSINNTVSKLKSLSQGNKSTISVTVIGFSSHIFKWTNTFVPISEFHYSYVEDVDGISDFNGLFSELHRIADQLEDDTQKYIILFSDGLSTEDYEDSFRLWSKSKYFHDIEKIIVSFDEDIEDLQSACFFNAFTNNGRIISIKNQEELLLTIFK